MTLIMAMTAATNVLGNNAANNDNFAYNCKVEGDQVTTQYVYRKTADGQALKHHLIYRYAYDEQGRVVSKEALKWDEARRAYGQYYRLNVAYNTDEVQLQLARWNPDEKAYSADLQRVVYRSTDETTNYLSYAWSEQSGSWELSSAISLNDATRLLANN